LLPDDPFDAARALWFEEYADTDFAYRMGMGVFRPRVVYPRLGKPVDEALVQKTLAEHAPRFFAYLDAELGDRDFLVGDTLSLADIAVATQFANQRHAGEAPDAVHFPRLAAYVTRMLALPVFAALEAEERASLAPE
jgi:glutathione S-transferase